MAQGSSFQDAIEHTWERRRDFFRLVFADAEGYVCLAFKSHTERTMRHRFYEYPEQLDKICADVDEVAGKMDHVYFCPNILHDEKFNKSNVKACTTVWADLDTCSPRNMLVRPSIVVKTSEDKWQALWRLDKPTAPEVAENISLRIAYFHKEQGADISGWDLTQLLRVPYTPNYKYKTVPLVTVTDTIGALYREEDFAVYPQIEALKKSQFRFHSLRIYRKTLRLKSYSGIAGF